MAFKKLDTSDLSKILDYTRFMKKPDDPSLKVFQASDGVYFNVTRIDQTQEEKEMSEKMSEFYKNYHAQQLEDVKRDC
jgi:hypothetical protein